jgi:hypothetical protein
MGVGAAGLTSWIGFSLSACSGAESNQVHVRLHNAFSRTSWSASSQISDAELGLCSQVRLSYITCWQRGNERAISAAVIGR